MSNEATLLAAVKAAPDDDTPRLAYADWLDTTGGLENQDRAEFIRVQCQLAQLPRNAPERPALAEREKSLAKQYAKRWAEPFREIIGFWAFRRGFLDSASVRTFEIGDKFVPLFQQLLDATPLRGIFVFEQDAQPEVLLPATPLMTGLREFGVRHGYPHLDGAIYRELFYSPHLSGLTYLDLEGHRHGSWFRPRTASAILKSPVLSNLDTLLLSDYITDLHPIVLSAVAKSPVLANLRRLSILATTFDRDHIRAFARARFAENLESLELQYCTLTQEAWEELLSASAFPNLKRLCLANARIGGVEMRVADSKKRAIEEQARNRFGSDALDLEQNFPERPWYYWWHGD